MGDSFQSNIESLIQSSGDRTLLLIDQNDEPSYDIFLNSSNFVILDADKLAKKRTIQRKSVSFILKEARSSLVYAIKNGKILVVRMGESKTDFLNTFCDECCNDLEFTSKYPPYKKLSYLPRSIILRNGADARQKTIWQQLLHREDMIDVDEIELEQNIKKFKVIITTVIPAEKIELQLLNGTLGLPGTIHDYNVHIF
ncbi:unnamed protein product [Rotaria socialis]